MEITELLKNSGALEQLSGQFGLDNGQVEEIVKGALPEITNSINENTSTEEGLKSFWDALNDHKDAPVEEMLTNLDKVDTEDGEKILGHILGDKQEALTESLSAKQGLSAASVGGVLKYLAPVLMAAIGKQAMKPAEKKGDNNDLLESMLGKDSSVTKMTKSFLDKNKDGSILDDLFGNFFKK